MRQRLFVVLVLASLAVAACNTVAGAGRDISAAGKAVSKTADDAKH